MRVFCKAVDIANPFLNLNVDDEASNFRFPEFRFV